MKNKDIGLRVAGTLLGIVGLVHAARLLTGFELSVAGVAIPLWINGVAAIVSVGLAVWLFRLSGRRQES
jgi:hypothetical protein